MAPTQSEQIKRLSAENAELASKVNHMEERVSKLEAALQAALETCGARHNEACIRVESVEENLCQLSEGQQELQYDQASLMLRLESQQMYSRKQTLLLTGSAVCLPTRGEDIRGIVLGLLNRYLGLTGLQPGDICACHRLKNPKVILVRFANLDHSEKVYRARTKPKLRGLLIFESLTTERLSVIDMLKALKAEGSPHVLSYYTQGGRIFVRTSEDREVRPIEIPFGLNQDQIKALCQGEQVSPTPIAVCDQFRAVNSASCPLQRRPGSKPNPWTLVTRNRRRAGPAGAPGDGRDGVTGGGRPGLLSLLSLPSSLNRLWRAGVLFAGRVLHPVPLLIHPGGVCQEGVLCPKLTHPMVEGHLTSPATLRLAHRVLQLALNLCLRSGHHELLHLKASWHSWC